MTVQLRTIEGGKAPARAPAVCPRCGRPYEDGERAVDRAWRRARRAAADGLAVTILLVYGAFGGFVAWVVAVMPHEAGWLPTVTTTVLLLLMFLALVARGLLDRWHPTYPEEQPR